MRSFWCGRRGLDWLRDMCILALGIGVTTVALAVGVDVVGPGKSEAFGAQVLALPNGNWVVTDPWWNSGRGRVALHDRFGNLIAALRGGEPNDGVGSNGVVLVGADNFVVVSPYWGTPVASPGGRRANVGAVTWVDGQTGLDAVVSCENSLCGGEAYDQIGIAGVTVLRNGNYVVASPLWDSGGMANVGAVTWGSGVAGITGAVGVTNSLHGSLSQDLVGSHGVVALTNGNYVVLSPAWNDITMPAVGAATWGNGMTGTVGAVSATNSLRGSHAGDQVGSDGITSLPNGNYVVVSSNWNNDLVPAVGATTWGHGATGIIGPVTTENSLHGSQPNDHVGKLGVTALSNGNYVVMSPYWDSPDGMEDVGAATWGSGATGIAGSVSVENSLYGGAEFDEIGSAWVTALANGNYVVASPDWDSELVSGAGAVTWGNGTTGIIGPVSSSNSLHGSHAGDHVGTSVTALANGNYVVASRYWDNAGISDVGAVTWGDGAAGIAGSVNTANSLHGSQASDQVGFPGVVALTNGNYVVFSPRWDNAGEVDVGAVTWGNGATSTAGSVGAANSLHGSRAGDQVGYGGVMALSNGNYLVRSPNWDSATGTVDVGAITWGSGESGVVGPVAETNSIHGSRLGDQAGSAGGMVLPNGNAVVASGYWDNFVLADVGAVTWFDGAAGSNVGAITWENSVIGSNASGGGYLTADYDSGSGRCPQLIIGRPADNMVTLWPEPWCLLKDGFE